MRMLGLEGLFVADAAGFVGKSVIIGGALAGIFFLRLDIRSGFVGKSVIIEGALAGNSFFFLDQILDRGSSANPSSSGGALAGNSFLDFRLDYYAKLSHGLYANLTSRLIYICTCVYVHVCVCVCVLWVGG